MGERTHHGNDLIAAVLRARDSACQVSPRGAKAPVHSRGTMTKQVATLALVLLATILSSPAGWCQAKFHHLDGGIINAVTFLDDGLHGWTAEEGGRMKFTEDGGNTWSPVTLEDEDIEATWVELRGVYARDIDHGWAVGDGGVVLRNVPGFSGQRWQLANEFDLITDMRDIPLPCGQNLATLYNIFMLPDNLTGWVVGLDGTLQKTVNGGTTWSPPSIPLFGCSNDPEGLYDIHFFSDGGA